MRPYLDAPRPLAFAHRGGAALWPENTLASFRGALELGVPYIETDIHRTRDGHIVVFHDARLERTTDGKGFVRHHTLADLKRLDAGYYFSPDGTSYPERGKGHTIPTLAELFDLSDTVRFNIEIKQGDPSMTEQVWRFLQDRDAVDRVLIAAEHDDIGDEFRRVSGGRTATSPGLRGVLAFWAAVRTGTWRRLGPRYDALQVPASYRGLTVVDERFVHAAHELGLHVHVWTIDDEAEMQRLLSLGVDGLMSDRPDRLMRVLGSSAGPPE